MLSHAMSNASNFSIEVRSPSLVQTRSPAAQDQHRRDSETAHKQAVAAASFAFERASERVLAAQGLKETNIEQAAATDGQVETRLHLGRKQSIRFTGLTAVPIRNRSITRRVVQQNGDISRLPIQYGSVMDGFSSEDRVSGASTSPQSRGNTKESHFPSSSASLRKLKRAKSMFILRGPATNLFSDEGLPDSSKAHQKPADSINDYSQLCDVANSRLQRSFSFLHGEKDHMASGLDTQRTLSAAAQLAREQYLRELELKGLKESSSPLAPSHNHKFQRVFRKSVRTGSTNSFGSAITSPAQVSKKSAPTKGLGYKARCLSFSLKKKLKQVFQYTSESKETIPIQQLDACRPHFGEYMSNSAGANQEYHQLTSPNIETLRQASSRTSSLDKVSGFCEGASPTKSIRSVQGEDEPGPLFESWMNSVPEHLLGATRPREKKRLSVIQEHGGPHQSSSNGRNYAELGNVFHAPIGDSGMSKKDENIYSTFQQKIGENRRLAQSEELFWEKDDIDDGVDANVSKPRSSLSTQPFTTRPPEWPSPDHSIESSNLVMGELTRTSSETHDICSPRDSSNDYDIREGLYEMYTSLTPQQIAAQNDVNNTNTKQPRRENKAAFFPSSMCMEITNVGPYRRILGFGGDSETGADSALEENTPIRLANESTLGSTSIYSRTSSGNTPEDNQSSSSLTKSETSPERKTIAVMNTSQCPSEEDFAPLTLDSKIPGQGKDLQVCRKPELSQPGNQEAGDIESFSAAGKENRHKRESAQLDDDIDLFRLRDDALTKKQTFEIPSNDSVPQPSLKNHASGSVFSRSPLLEIGQPTTPGRSEECLSSSLCQVPNPYRSSNRDQEMSSRRRNKNGSEVAGRTASTNSLKSEGSGLLGNRDVYVLRHGLPCSTADVRIGITQERGSTTPEPIRAVFRTNKTAKFQGYNSPERLARIRRLQSSKSLASFNKRLVGSKGAGHEREQDNKELVDPTFKSPMRREGFPSHHFYSTTIDETHSAGVRGMLDSFLNTRGRKMKVIEDKSIGLAFL